MTTAANVAMKRHRVLLSVPDSLYQWLSSETGRRGATMDQLLFQALELYAQTASAPFDMTRTHTWKLCGALRVAEAEPEYVVAHDENGRAVTNYAEHADDVLYRNR